MNNENTNVEDARGDLFELIKELSEAGVKYVVCGGVACVLHGVERATYDLDISIPFENDNLDKIIKVANKFELIPRIPEPVEALKDEIKRKNWLEKKGALVYTFVSKKTPLQLDIFLSYPRTYEELFSKADELVIEGIKFKVSSIEDLIFVKKHIEPMRDKDLTDIKELEIIHEQKNKSRKRS